MASLLATACQVSDQTIDILKHRTEHFEGASGPPFAPSSLGPALDRL